MREIELNIEKENKRIWCSFYRDDYLLCNECYSKKIGICRLFHYITIGE